MVSFDVIWLFTNIPTTDALTVVGRSSPETTPWTTDRPPRLSTHQREQIRNWKNPTTLTSSYCWIPITHHSTQITTSTEAKKNDGQNLNMAVKTWGPKRTFNKAASEQPETQDQKLDTETSKEQHGVCSSMQWRVSELNKRMEQHRRNNISSGCR